MTEPTRHELNQFLCNRCNKPDAELFGMMVSSNEGRWVSYEDYARLKAEVERLDALCKQLLKQHSDISCENITLRRAGDALLPFIGDYMGWRLVVKNWSSAREGKQS